MREEGTTGGRGKRCTVLLNGKARWWVGRRCRYEEGNKGEKKKEGTPATQRPRSLSIEAAYERDSNDKLGQCYSIAANTGTF